MNLRQKLYRPSKPIEEITTEPYKPHRLPCSLKFLHKQEYVADLWSSSLRDVQFIVTLGEDKEDLEQGYKIVHMSDLDITTYKKTFKLYPSTKVCEIEPDPKYTWVRCFVVRGLKYFEYKSEVFPTQMLTGNMPLKIEWYDEHEKKNN